MQLNEYRRPALFPSRKCCINVRKIDKNTRPPKGTRSGKQLFFPYPSVFSESYVRCVYWTDAEFSSFIGVKDIDNLDKHRMNTWSGLTHPYAIAIDFHSK